jgi:hypothetical protein
MAPKKAKTTATLATPSFNKHPGAFKSLDVFPAAILKNIVDRLNYPTLEMLRATCKTLRGQASEKQVHEIFMDLRLDQVCYIEPENDDDWTVCRDCLKFCDHNTTGFEHTTAPKLQYSLCSREYVAVLRLGVFVILPEGCECEFYECCDRGDEGCGPLSICKACYGLTGKQRSGKGKRKAFVKRYGAWLRLQWLESAGRSQQQKYDSD